MAVGEEEEEEEDKWKVGGGYRKTLHPNLHNAVNSTSIRSAGVTGDQS